MKSFFHLINPLKVNSGSFRIFQRIPFINRAKKIRRTKEILKTVNNQQSELNWEIVEPCPMELYDSAGIQVGDKLFVICGYSNLNKVINSIYVLDLEKRRWVDKIDTPANMPQSHLAVSAEEKRYIYFVSGQLGPQCSPAIPDAFVFDLIKRKWGKIPPLPEPRYAGTMQLWNGRLHYVAGSMPDRWTSAKNHWSIAASEGKALEEGWRIEPSIPKGGCHLTSAVVDNKFFVFGGQEGDFKPIPGNPNFVCNGRTPEYYHSQTYMLSAGEGLWKRMNDMPVACSHIDFSSVTIGKKIIFAGGQIYKNPKTFELKLTDVIQAYDTQSDKWSIAGRLPCRLKTAVAGYRDGWVYVTVGQRDAGPENAAPHDVVGFTWRSKLDIS